MAYRNDRYIAALSREATQGDFKVAYVVRAVTVGSYTLPPSQIEDMYRPYYRALSGLPVDKLVIRDRAKKEIKRAANTAKSSVKSDLGIPGKLTDKDYESVYTQAVNNLDHYRITQLNFLRNSIFARAGLDFSKTNPMLFEKFSHYSWYHPGASLSSEIYKDLIPLRKENVQKLLAEERRRGGGLVLADFYRVRIKALTEKDQLKNGIL